MKRGSYSIGRFTDLEKNKVANEVALPEDNVEQVRQSFTCPFLNKTTGYKNQLLYRVSLSLFKAAALLVVLYIFTCSLDLLSRGFRLLGGRTTATFFQKELLQNKVVGVGVGILTTALLHSSSTSTSIVVAMVGVGILKVPQAIPIIMGANIGTSITTSLSTIISFPKVGDVEQFRLAFSSATLHSMFNWCSVVVLLVIESFTSYLKNTSSHLQEWMIKWVSNPSEIHFLYLITKPAVNLIVQINDDALKCSAVDLLANCTMSLIACKNSNKTTADSECGTSIFKNTTMDDTSVGLIVLVIAVISIVSCLFLNVKILKSILQGDFAKTLAAKLNAEIPYVPWLTGYVAIVFGTLVTILIQSSSVFTSAMTPLVGLDFLTLKRAYPLTIGANIGTTATALMTALASKHSPAGVQIALCHVLFNLTGALIFYPVPYFRFPITMAEYLGKRTAKYRWFAVVFMALMFVIIPFIFVVLCNFTKKPEIVVFVGAMMVTIYLFISCINTIRNKCPVILPVSYRSWKWLPIWMRSLEPYDKLIRESACCSHCSKAAQSSSRTVPDTKLIVKIGEVKIFATDTTELSIKRNLTPTGGHANSAFVVNENNERQT